MFKKAQGISMNVIIIAAIALLVLVVLSVIFLGRIGSFSEQTADCQNKGGRCAAVDEACGQEGTGVETYGIPFPGWDCPVEGETCCVQA